MDGWGGPSLPASEFGLLTENRCADRPEGEGLFEFEGFKVREGFKVMESFSL